MPFSTVCIHRYWLASDALPTCGNGAGLTGGRNNGAWELLKQVRLVGVAEGLPGSAILLLLLAVLALAGVKTVVQRKLGWMGGKRPLVSTLIYIMTSTVDNCGPDCCPR